MKKNALKAWLAYKLYLLASNRCGNAAMLNHYSELYSKYKPEYWSSRAWWGT